MQIVNICPASWRADNSPAASNRRPASHRSWLAGWKNKLGVADPPAAAANSRQLFVLFCFVATRLTQPSLVAQACLLRRAIIFSQLSKRQKAEQQQQQQRSVSLNPNKWRTKLPPPTQVRRCAFVCVRWPQLKLILSSRHRRLLLLLGRSNMAVLCIFSLATDRCIGISQRTRRNKERRLGKERGSVSAAQSI